MHRLIKGLTVLSLVAVLAVAAYPAQIYWYFTQGTAAVFQTDDLAKVASYSHSAVETRVVVKRGESVWVHVPFTNPAQDGVFIDMVRLIWKADARNIFISQVEVCDVLTKLWSKTGNFQGAISTSSAKTTDWKLGQNWKVQGGLTVSFLVTNKGGKDQGVSLCSVGVHGGVDTSHR